MSSAAGWYPQQDGRQRYWDGELWTEDYVQAVLTATSPATAPGGRGLRRPTRWAAGAAALGTALALIATGACAAPSDASRTSSTTATTRAPVSTTAAVAEAEALTAAQAATTPEAARMVDAAAAEAAQTTASAAAAKAASVATAVAQARSGTALAAVAGLTVKGRAPKTGYRRDQFGQAWFDADHNGCDTRNDILRRDLHSRQMNACKVLAGTLAPDPYTGTPSGSSTAVPARSTSTTWSRSRTRGRKAPRDGRPVSGSPLPTTG